MSTQPQVYALRFEAYSSPLGVGHATPRLSWRYHSDDNTIQDWTQSAYDVEVTREGTAAEVFHVASDNSVLVPWPTDPLKSRESAQVRLRAYSAAGKTATEWSASETVEAGLLTTNDWSAKPMAIRQDATPKGPLRPVRFRKSFNIPQGAKAARKVRLYTTAWGVYEIHINGKRIGEQVMAPGWTSYKHRLLYQTYEIPLDLLRLDGGANVIGVEVGEGWYAGRMGFNGGKRYLYGDQLASLVQLEVDFDGEQEKLVVASDGSWKCKRSAVLVSEIYDGETYDMTQDENWHGEHGASDDSSWTAAIELSLPLSVLEAQEAPPVTITETVSPKEIFRSPSGKVLVDFGQNLVGKVKIRKLKLKSGNSVTITHAEVLENGELGIRPLRAAKCTDVIHFSDEELVDWSPKFTFHGFRYIQIDGWETGSGEELPDKSDLEAVVMHTDMHRTGYFSCSDEMINKLHKNVVWGMRGNFLSIPTDCPQRDERLGWTGDINVFTPSANFLYDTSGMLNNWLHDLLVEQMNDEAHCTPGIVVPNILRDKWGTRGQAIWQDVSIMTPWALYQSFADKELLRRQHISMKGWLEEGVSRGPDDMWDPEFWQLGDWLDPAAPSDEPSKSRTDGTLVADTYLVHVTSVLATISSLLGASADAEKYESKAAELKRKFQDKYITPAGLLVSDTQTGISLALTFNLYRSAAERKMAGSRLSRLVRASGFRIATGFAGTPQIAHALASTGQPQLAYRMLHEERCPSWLYPITMGATTMWERWDSMLPDGSINKGEMTSFNHFALGSVADFLHATVGGISPMEPGWRVVRVKPVPGGKVTSADVSFEGPYGLVKCSWTLKEKAFKMKVDIPPGSKGWVVLPGKGEEEGKMVGSGQHEFECQYEIGKWPEPLIDPFCAPDVVQ